MDDDLRFNRHLALFGIAGQARIAKTNVTVVGASGLGTPTLLYLAFLSPREICIVEPGLFTESGRNRNFAARNEDQAEVVTKADLAARMVKMKSSNTIVKVIPEPLESLSTFTAIQNADYVFGCLDLDGARFVLNEVCLAYETPLIDMASDVQAEASEFGGRVTVVRPGEGCLYCLGLLDDRDVRRYLSSSGELKNEACAYGVPVDQLSPGTGPSVATINGIIAGLGVTEFWSDVTGLRKTHRCISYLGSEAVLRRSRDQPPDDCYYCNVVRAAGDSSSVHRHIVQQG